MTDTFHYLQHYDIIERPLLKRLGKQLLQADYTPIQFRFPDAPKGGATPEEGVLVFRSLLKRLGITSLIDVSFTVDGNLLTITFSPKGA